MASVKKKALYNVNTVHVVLAQGEAMISVFNVGRTVSVTKLPDMRTYQNVCYGYGHRHLLYPLESRHGIGCGRGKICVVKIRHLSKDKCNVGGLYTQYQIITFNILNRLSNANFEDNFK
jgi:hypothetical protein